MAQAKLAAAAFQPERKQEPISVSGLRYVYLPNSTPRERSLLRILYPPDVHMKASV